MDPSAAAAVVAVPPTPPPAAPSTSAAAVDVGALTEAMGTEAAVDGEVDEPEQMRLNERADDEVIDGTSQLDALHGQKVTRFDDPALALPPDLLKGLAEMSFTRPSLIQCISLPKIWDGRNLLAQSHNGTGKTACFVLGMLRICDHAVKQPQALCVTPTRELAIQIGSEVNKMGKYLLQSTGMTVKTILREEKWERGAKMADQIVIGTAGKVISLMSIKVLVTDQIKIFVLDEADDMLGLGMGDNTKRIRKTLKGPGGKLQTLFFSATWKPETVKFAKSLAGIGGEAAWAEVTIKRKFIFNDQVAQLFLQCDGRNDKVSRLGDLLGMLDAGQMIIFVQTREAVDTLAKKLTENGHTVSALHGKMEEKNRDKVIKAFHEGVSRILITTNVLARGIDVPAVTLVIQFDMPRMQGGMCDPETYLHRVGRTGRFGRKGVALNMIENPKELKVLKEIELYYDRKDMIKEIPKDMDPEAVQELLTVKN